MSDAWPTAFGRIRRVAEVYSRVIDPDGRGLVDPVLTELNARAVKP